jgi:hypothetical protein
MMEKNEDKMPIYGYQCLDCGGHDQRVAGLDDHTAICIDCGGLMLRLDEEIFWPYFEEFSTQPSTPDPLAKN